MKPLDAGCARENNGPMLKSGGVWGLLKGSNKKQLHIGSFQGAAIASQPLAALCIRTKFEQNVG